MFTVGETPTYRVVFRDQDQVPYEPDTVVLTLRAPDGTISTPAVSALGDGEYVGTEEADQRGIWRWEWEGTGPGFLSATDEGSICVRASLVSV